MASRKQCERGFTLVEMLVVVLILGIIAALAMPTLKPQRALQLEAAAQQVAGALRFARVESIRTGIPHGIRVDSSTQELKVFMLDQATDPPTELFTPKHPLEKHAYTVDFDDLGAAVSATFSFADGGPVDVVSAFDSRGEPINPANGARLTSGTVTVSRDGSYRIAAVDPMTGRIAVSELGIVALGPPIDPLPPIEEEW